MGFRQRLERRQERWWSILNGTKIRTPASVVFNWFILSLILLNVIAVTLETLESVRAVYEAQLYAFELFSVIAFTLEYVARLWCAPAGPRVTLKRLEEGRAVGDAEEIAALQIDHEEELELAGSRLRWAITPMALVDLVAVLPSLLPAVLGIDMRFLRALRLLRFFRLLKVARYSRTLNRFRLVLREKKEELLVSFFVLFLCLILASSTMYYVEREAQPEAFGSIPHSMWWAVATLTTVGYGDVYPISAMGRVLSAVIAIAGIGLFGLPAGILASGFMEEIDKSKEQLKTLAAAYQPAPPPSAAEGAACPHCGEAIRLRIDTGD
jgi:voltage-gated potassium channel